MVKLLLWIVGVLVAAILGVAAYYLWRGAPEAIRKNNTDYNEKKMAKAK